TTLRASSLSARVSPATRPKAVTTRTASSNEQTARSTPRSNTGGTASPPPCILRSSLDTRLDRSEVLPPQPWCLNARLVFSDGAHARRPRARGQRVGAAPARLPERG